MIIYSIKEIVDATNNFLKPEDIKKNKKDSFRKNKTLLLTDEITEDIKTQKEISIKKLNTDPKKTTTIVPVKTNDLIDELYLKFNKKIKKNTIKLIFELQKEVSDLNKKNKNLESSNNQLKIQINNLTKEFTKIGEQNKNLINERNNLNKNVSMLTEKLNDTYNKIKILEETENKLENEVKEKNNLNHKISELKLTLNDTRREIKNLRDTKNELDKEILEFKSKEEINNKKIYDISEVENKNKFFQEENLRIGSELLEIKKKHDILKKEIEKYETQKSNLISKINSVNDALNNTNIVTNVFDNKVENKVNVTDSNKLEKKITSDLDDQIKNIFSKT